MKLLVGFLQDSSIVDALGVKHAEVGKPCPERDEANKPKVLRQRLSETRDALERTAIPQV